MPGVGVSHVTGPSPRVRGSRAQDPRAVRAHGSIPACAGKPPGAPCTCTPTRVHPRVCGEAPAGTSTPILTEGPSPRVRGSRRLPRPAGGPAGSIPACAGKPGKSCASASKRRVHPRVCGEAMLSVGETRPCRGPSPRVRGSPGPSSLRRRRRGSIPACAGKPPAGSPACSLAGVHPRVCGEAAYWLPVPPDTRGPSPRVRGSLGDAFSRPPAPRSIPACAGKPCAPPDCRSWTTVHPRVCGEADVRERVLEGRGGPSPRVRGSLHPPRHSGNDHGSIPACAGKPRAGRTWATR